jgi:hypothetical protein
MLRRVLAGLAVAACVAFSTTRAVHADVSLTQGHIVGTITFTADFVPTNLTVYAGNPLNEPIRYGSKVEAVLQGTQPAGALTTSTWSYDLTVEALLTTHYQVRPIAYQNQNPPFLTERVPFPDFPAQPLVVSPGNTTPLDIDYTPVMVKGTLTAVAMNAAPLPLFSIYLNAFDATVDTIQPDCVGSINFCLSAPNTNTAGPDYTLYLKPGRSYVLYSQAVSFYESQLGSGAYNAIEFNDGDVLDATNKAGGDVIVKNYSLVEKAEVVGALQLNVPNGYTVYNKGITVSGQTTTPNQSFFDIFYPSPYNPAPTYIARLFDFVDFNKPINVSPSFQLSQNGQVGLIFPNQVITAHPDQVSTANFSGDAGLLTGTFTFFPAYRVTNSYPDIQVASASLGNTYAPFVPDPSNGATYQLLAFADTWSYWRLGWQFDMSNPNFASRYAINNYLNLANAHVTGINDVVNNDFVFNTALLKVFFTAPVNGVLSDPQLDVQSADPQGQISESGHADGFNQTNVVNGEARQVLRVSDVNYPVPFRVDRTAVVNGSRVTFGPFTVTPHPGEVIVVGVPANIHLTLTSPISGSSSADCQFQVTGTAGGGKAIATITVNGQTVPFVAAPLPGDPNRVTFDVSAASANGTIIVVATDVDGHSVTQTVDVVCLNPCSSDSTAPTVTASVSAHSLWPPNHNLVSVGLAASATDSCTANPAIGVAVYSNEDDQEETGEGNFSPDAKSIAPGTLRLRSERKGNGPGRVYLIVTSATDDKSNVGRACTAVVVPHDQSAASMASVNAMAASAVSACSATGSAPAGYYVVGDGPVVGPKQ